MKSKRGVDSKAGTLKMENSAMKLRNMISKSASLLLIAMAGFGMMSFTQDDTAVNSLDTNLSKKEITTETAKVVTDENCCVAVVTKPGDEIKKALNINMPQTKAILVADQENSRVFVADVKERSLWNMSVMSARTKADREMAFNFELSKLIPAANASENADEIMITLLTEDVILKSTGAVLKNAAVADAEMASQFMTDHFSITIKADAASIAQADASVIRAFERANLPSIALPSATATAQADAEMAQK